MNIPVMYNDNKIDEIDKSRLDELLSMNKIKMFMRSDGWAMVDVAAIRGAGGMYSGPDRRGLYGLMNESVYKIQV